MRRGGSSICTMADICDIFGTTNQTVQVWVKQGCPFIQRGDRGIEWKFESGLVAKWREEQAVEIALERLQRDKKPDKPQAVMATPENNLIDATLRGKLATAQLKEYELARIKGETVTIHEVRAIYEEDLAVVRARILAIPGRLAQELAIESDAVKIERIIKREVSDALSELSYDENAILDSSNA